MEQLGEATGYRIPGGKTEADGLPESGGGESVAATPEAIDGMDQGQLVELIKSEGLDIDPEGMDSDQLRYAVAEGLGFEVVDEENGDEQEEELRNERPGRDQRAIEQKIRADLELEYSARLKRAQTVEDKVRILEMIENDPATYVPKIAEHFGFKIVPVGEGTGGDEELPELEPLEGESLPAYMKRYAKELKKVLGKAPAAQPKAQPKAKVPDRAQEVFGFLERYHPDYMLYSDEMQEVLKKDPQLAYNPSLLYDRAKEAKEGKRKASGAKKIIQRKGEAKMGERPTKPMRVASGVKSPLSFDDAWERAKRQAAQLK